MTYRLVLPDGSHRDAYEAMMDRWEAMEENIQPELLRRYSKGIGGNVSYEKWLSWCEDDRTTGSMLSTGVPAALHFLVDEAGVIYGAVVQNQGRTHMGHLHAGIAPWYRGKGYGTLLLKLSLELCYEQGMKQVEVVTCQWNQRAIRVLEKNGGRLIKAFVEDDVAWLRYLFEPEKSGSFSENH